MEGRLQKIAHKYAVFFLLFFGNALTEHGISALLVRINVASEVYRFLYAFKGIRETCHANLTSRRRCPLGLPLQLGFRSNSHFWAASTDSFRCRSKCAPWKRSDDELWVQEAVRIPYLYAQQTFAAFHAAMAARRRELVSELPGDFWAIFDVQVTLRHRKAKHVSPACNRRRQIRPSRSSYVT